MRSTGWQTSSHPGWSKTRRCSVVLSENLEEILTDSVLVRQSSESSIVLEEDNVMEVEVTDMPQHSATINLRRIGSLSGIKDGVWKQICDYLLVCAVDDRDLAIFIELKKTVNEGGRGMEQLRRSLPILEYLREICRLQHRRTRSESPPTVRYVLIGLKQTFRLDKQRVRPRTGVEKENYRDIEIHTFLGPSVGFKLLSGR